MSITTNNKGAQILACYPKWEDGIDISFKTNTIIAESLIGREERRASQQRPLISLSFTAINLEQRQSGYFRRLMENRGERPIGMPVWTEAVLLKTTAQVGDTVLKCDARNRLFPWFRWAVLWSGPFWFEVVDIAELNGGNVVLVSPLEKKYKRGSFLMPLCFGFVKIPDSEFMNPSISEIDIDFEERPGFESFHEGEGQVKKTGASSIEDFEERLETQEGGDSLQDYSIFPIRPNWGDDPEQGAVDDISFESLFGGVTLPYEVYRIKRRFLKFSYTCDRYNLQKVLKHFENKDGCLGGFWVPTWTKDYTVAETAARDSSTILIKSAGVSKMPERYSAFFACVNGSLILLEGESSIQGETEKITLKTPLSVTLLSGSTLSGAVYCRFRNDELSVRCLHPYRLFEFDCEFLEIPKELEIENTSKTIYLYKLTIGDEETYWANWQYAVQTKETVESEEKTVFWRAGDITHDSIEHKEDMLGEELSLTCKGVIRDYLIQKKASGDLLEVEVFELQDSVSKNIFKGVEVQRTTNANGEINVSLSSDLRVLNREMPRFKVQRPCNYLLYSDSCGAIKSNFTFTVTIESIEGRVLTAILTGEEGKEEKFFTGATLTIDGIGKYIVLSDALDSADKTRRFFKLDANVSVVAVGRSAIVTAWCDKTIYCCQNRFGNSINFGGCPYLPNNNPLEQAEVDEATGGKK